MCRTTTTPPHDCLRQTDYKPAIYSFFACLKYHVNMYAKLYIHNCTCSSSITNSYQKLWTLCHICGLNQLDGEEGGNSNIFHNLMHDILRHVLDAFLHIVVGQTYLSQLVGTCIVQDKLCSFKHARFDESLQWCAASSVLRSEERSCMRPPQFCCPANHERTFRCIHINRFK